SSFSRFQPVFTAQGRVHEYAVADSFMPWRAVDSAPQRARLRAAAAFASRPDAPIDSSFDHASTAPGDADRPQRSGPDLASGSSREQLCFGAAARRDRTHSAARRLTFQLPLISRSMPQAQAVASYAEFRPGSRAQSSPA
ncbi:hypothetical protein OY671_010473, partial [Metschnikowia pulcherrima]